jgi:hypothetical protein
MSFTRDVDSVSTNAATATNGSVTLDGAGVSSGKWTISNSGNSLSGVAGARLRFSNPTEGVSWTLTGKDQDGNAITEVVAGAAGSPATDTVQYFSEVSSITSDGEAAAQTIGHTYYYSTRSYGLNWRATEPATYATMDGIVAGTTVFPIQEHFGTGATASLATNGWNTLTTAGGASATEGTLHARYVRMITTATHGAAVTFAVLQN